MTISARILADSINEYGVRLTTFLFHYPRYIHAEIMTHRVFSRNGASSRAIPAERMIDMLREETAIPSWYLNQKGMSSEIPLSPEAEDEAEAIWLTARNQAISSARRLLNLKVHKSIVNRLLEPFQMYTLLVSSTEWPNFAVQRYAPDAQPEIKDLTYKWGMAYLKSEPKRLKCGEWHIPFNDMMPVDLDIRQQLMVATARAARLSYLTFDGQFSLASDYALHDRLLEARHFSPFEHCALAVAEPWRHKGNFGPGWFQYRHMHANESVHETDLRKLFGLEE